MQEYNYTLLDWQSLETGHTPNGRWVGATCSLRPAPDECAIAQLQRIDAEVADEGAVV